MRIAKTACIYSVLAIAFFGSSFNVAKGSQIIFGANYEFSGGAAPAGTNPWVTVELDDHGTTGSVTLTMTATNLTGNESVKEWFLNLDPALNPNDLTFSAPTVLSGSFDVSAIVKGANAFKADGDGYYDLNIEFDQSGPSSRFTAGDSVSFTITGPSSLTANSFNFMSLPGGSNGVYSMAAHVLNTPNGGGSSGWVAAVPEPSTLMLCGMALLGLLVYGERRRAR